MKKIISALAVTVALASIGSAQAYQNCDMKRAALERQITLAQQYGNTYKVAGLRQALAEVNAHCNNGSLAADAQKKVTKLEKKGAEKQEDIRELQDDLRKAQAKGDSKKIAKYKSKIADKQSDLRDLQRELKEARAELVAQK